jgi:flagellar basal body-associated protein FliL
MEEDQQFQNLEIQEELLGISKSKNKIILIFGTVITLLILIGLILLIINLSKKDNDTHDNNINDNVNNDKKDNTNDEIKRFYPLFPSFIKGDSSGNCELNKGGLSLVKGSEIQFMKKFISSVENKKFYEMTKVSGRFDTSLSADVSIYHNDVSFKNHFEYIKEKEVNSTSCFLIAKYDLGSLSINNDDISLSDQMKKKINYIAEDYSLNDTEKAEELDKAFESYGFFIPLKINLGGQFIIDSKDIESATSTKVLDDLIIAINGSLTYDNITINETTNTSISGKINNIMKNMFNFKKTSIVGGNIYKNNFEDWLSTLTLENCEIIGYSNIIPITDLLDNELKRKILKPLKEIEKKYNRRKRYIEIYQNLKPKSNNRNWTKERKGTDGDGLIKQDDLIYLKKFKIEKEWSTFYVERDFKEPFEDIIVGWKIDSQKDKNGEWSLEENPLLKNKMNAHFSSQWLRGIIYEITIYFMDYPE